MVYQKEINLKTTHHGEMYDLTTQVMSIVKESGVRNGIVNVFNVGSTAGIGTIEIEPGLSKDMINVLDRLIPPSREYEHEKAWHDGNGHSHIQATMIGPSLTIPIKGGNLMLGTWQQVFHIECDIKPRIRTVFVTVIGDC